MIGHLAIEAKPTEPAISQVEVYLLAQPSLGADARAITNQQHPDQQLGIDRRPTHRAIKWRQPNPQIGEVNETIDGPQQMIRRNMPIERELVEQGTLIDAPLTHH